MRRTIILLMLLLSIAYAQENLRAPVVLLEAESITGGKETGTAFLVGQREGRLYFFTAWHVVEYSPDVIDIRFRNGQRSTARVENYFDRPLDVALISCPSPAGYRAPPSFALATAEPMAFQSVYIVGHPEGNHWDINVRSSVKEGEINFDSRFFSLNPEGIRPGSSGSPVLTQDRRLLGMVLEEGAVRVRVLSRSTLLRLLQSWNPPTDLMVGIPDEIDNSAISETEIQYRLALNEATYAFANAAWRQAREAYQRAHRLKPSAELAEKLRDCGEEIERDSLYVLLLDQGSLAAQPEMALSLFKQAKEQRDTEQIRELIQRQENLMREINKPRQTRIPRSSRTPSGRTYTDPLIGTMVLVRGGSFTMGSKETQWEQPPHPVTVADFYIGETEVTQQQWRAVMGSDPPRLGFPGCDACPVEGVSWEDVQAFLGKLNKQTGLAYRLPTEAEWEYAAGGGSGQRSKWAGTDEEDRLGDYAWYRSNSGRKTHPVREKEPNTLGLYDMSGNVWEWCEDDWHSNYEYAPDDGQAWVKDPRGAARVLRGGGWFNASGNCRVAYRFYGSSSGRGNDLGFRLARQF
ncbi:MAG: SUMF1/EgtB/PvdO family nonheme iron enzyme [Bacteroidota bacterium]